MKTNDNRLDSDAFEDLMHEVGVLDALEKEREQNFLEIMSTIRIRRRKRIFFSISCTAAAAVTMFLILMLPAGKKDMSEIPEVPTLITDSGESFVLEDRDSYTLDLLAVSDTREEPAKVRPEDVPAENEAAQETFVKASSVRRSTVVIPQGYTYNILFDDGTQAYLNSGSYIEFPESFAGREERRVSLRGEGYFKVAKSDKPFIVTASGVEIKVYGTEFNVNAGKEGKVETILVSGCVGVRENAMAEEIIMEPGNMLTCDIVEHRTDVRKVDPYDYLAWMRGDFTYTDRPLSELIEEIEAFYGIDVNSDGVAVDMPVTINLSRKLGHRQIMEILELAFGIGFKKTGEKTYNCITNFN